MAITLLSACLAAYSWDWLSDYGTESASATLRNVGLIVAAPIALVIAIWRSLVAYEQSETARRSLNEGRYQKASEMLGSSVLSVRLGGIYALCQLAEDHPREFHLQVVRLLSAFVRHPTQEALVEVTEATEGGYGLPAVPREEVQTIFDVSW